MSEQHPKKESNLILFRTAKEAMEKGAVCVTKADGVRIFDQDGKAYLDLMAGYTRPIHIGYGREEMARTIYDQIKEMTYFATMNFTSPRPEELASVMADLCPGDVNRFFFTCGGSESVEAAMKLAKHYHYFRGDKQRFKVFSRRGAYHGVTFAALRALGCVLPMRQMMEPLTPGGVFIESPYCYRCPLRLEYPSCDLACAWDLERTIQFEDPDLVSAFIGEPIQQGFGALAPPDGYWEVIREICSKYGVLLIIDEVICGFGRTGKWFGVDHFPIQPDLMTFAKGLSSGYQAMGAVGCTDEVWAPIEIFNHLFTYGNHPVGCAAALKNIEILKREELIKRSEEIGAYFLEKLRELEDHPLVGQVRGRGLWLGIDLTEDKKTKPVFPMARLNSICERAQEKGAIIKLMGSAIELAPPLVIEKADIDEGVKIIRECLDEEARDLGLL